MWTVLWVKLMVVLVFQFTRIVSLPIVNAMSNSLGLWTSSVIVVVSPSRQRHAGNGMRQPIMVKSDLVTCSENCWTSVQSHRAWRYVCVHISHGSRPIFGIFRAVQWTRWNILYWISWRLEFFDTYQIFLQICWVGSIINCSELHLVCKTAVKHEQQNTERR